MTLGQEALHRLVSPARVTDHYRKVTVDDAIQPAAHVDGKSSETTRAANEHHRHPAR